MLDFGLAKAAVQNVSPVANDGVETMHDDPLMNSPTVTSAATLPGLILGTAAYMAPEQARGKIVDKRADIWAFGCVFYEMLTGYRAFAGNDVSDTLALILTKEADWRLLPAATTAPVRTLLRRCLQKDPRNRLRDLGDARLQLQEALDEPAATTVTGWHPPVMLLLAVSIALAAVMGAFDSILPWRQSHAETGVVRFSIVPPAGSNFLLAYPAAAVSPDGSRVVLVVERDRETYLALRPIDAVELTRIPGTEGGNRPFFSPDGKWLAFTAQQKLKRVPLDGGSPLVVCDAQWGGGTWGVDDTIIFTQHYSSGLWRVPAGGGTPVKLTDPDPSRGELGHFWPQLLPDGKHVIFTSFSTPVERSMISVYSLESREQRTLVQGAMHAWYTPTGHLVYADANSIVAVPFDAGRLAVNGTAVPALDDVYTYFTNGIAQLAVSPSGTIAYIRKSAAQQQSELMWMDRNGKAQPAVPGRRRYSQPRLSPDGQRLAITIDDGTRDVWTYDFARGVLSRVTSGTASDFGAVWTPDAHQIAFVSERPVFQILRKMVSGGAAEEPIVAGPYDTQPNSFSPDGKLLVYEQQHPQTRDDLWVVPMDGERKGRPLLTSAFSEGEGMVSPDGRWLAFHSDESGRPEVYVQAFPEAGERWQVSSGGGERPRWSRDGRELFYGIKARVMAVTARASGKDFVAGKPTVILEADYLEFDVAPEGQRFIVLRRDPAAQPPELQVVVHWFDDLRKRMATAPR